MLECSALEEFQKIEKFIEKKDVSFENHSKLFIYKVFTDIFNEEIVASAAIDENAI